MIKAFFQLYFPSACSLQNFTQHPSSSCLIHPASLFEQNKDHKRGMLLLCLAPRRIKTLFGLAWLSPSKSYTPLAHENNLSCWRKRDISFGTATCKHLKQRLPSTSLQKGPVTNLSLQVLSLEVKDPRW